MNRILASAEVASDPWARKAVKAIKLLELNYEKEPVRDELIAACLYGHLGDENPLNALKPVLERLRNLNVVSFSEKEGYKIQSSAGQEWQRERDDFGVGIDERNRLIREKLAELMKDPERPKLNGRAFYWSALFSDGRAIADERLLHSSDEACVTIDFRFPAGKRDQSKADWAGLSADQQHTDRIVWVATEQDLDVVKELGKSRSMLAKYQQRSSSLAGEKKKLLLEEQDRRDHLENKASKLVESMFVEGTLYFRGKPEAAREYGATFNAVMSTVGTARLPQLYPHHTDVAVTDTELQQLLLPALAGVSAKFLDGKLGLLSQDGGKFLPTCNGPVPKLIYAYIEKNEGTAGNVLLQDFSRPPYGFPSDVVRACVLSLLRDHRVKLKLDDGSTLTSVADASARETFLQVTRFKKTEIFPNKDETITQRDLVGMRKFFEKLGQDLEPTQEVIADAVFKHFVPLRERLRTLEVRFNLLPGRPELEDTLKKLARALEHCRSERDVAPTIKALKAELSVSDRGSAGAAAASHRPLGRGAGGGSRGSGGTGLPGGAVAARYGDWTCRRGHHVVAQPAEAQATVAGHRCAEARARTHRRPLRGASAAFAAGSRVERRDRAQPTAAKARLREALGRRGTPRLQTDRAGAHANDRCRGSAAAP
jgi:hypothetical protein